MAVSAITIGTCLNAYNDGSGKLNQVPPLAVDCSASFAFSRVTALTTSHDNCPQAPTAGRWSYAHTFADGSVKVMCIDRVFRPGQCFPAALSRQADGSVGGRANLYIVWGCDRTQVPSGYNALMVISAVLDGGTCPERSGVRSMTWTALNGAAKICAWQRG